MRFPRLLAGDVDPERRGGRGRRRCAGRPLRRETKGGHGKENDHKGRYNGVCGALFEHLARSIHSRFPPPPTARESLSLSIGRSNDAQPTSELFFRGVRARRSRPPRFPRRNTPRAVFLMPPLCAGSGSSVGRIRTRGASRPSEGVLCLDSPRGNEIPRADCIPSSDDS